MYPKMPAESRMFTSGPATAIDNSSDGRSIRSMRESPPIGNITISVVRTPKRSAHKRVPHFMQ